MRQKYRRVKDFRGESRREASDRGDWIYGRRPVLEVVKAAQRHLYEAVLPPEGRDSPEVAELRGLGLTRCGLGDRSRVV